MTEKLVTIATYADPIAANLAKIKLASEDIDCFLAGELAASIYTGVLGGIKLQVKQSYVEKAIEALNRLPDDTEFDRSDDEDSTLPG